MSILDRQGELTDVDGIKLPKCGVLSVEETIVYNEMAQQSAEFLKGMTSAAGDLEVALRCIAILLRRIDPKWTLEQTREVQWTLPLEGEGSKAQTFKPDALLMESLFNFFKGERDRWPEADAPAEKGDADAPGKPPTGKTSTGGSRKRTPATKPSAASKAS